MTEVSLLINNLRKIFRTQSGSVEAIASVTLELYPGEILSVVGPSGDEVAVPDRLGKAYRA